MRVTEKTFVKAINSLCCPYWVKDYLLEREEQICHYINVYDDELEEAIADNDWRSAAAIRHQIEMFTAILVYIENNIGWKEYPPF